MFRFSWQMGCAAALAALMVGAAGCASGPRRTDAQKQLDRETAQRVEAALQADKDLYSNHIQVDAKNGVVYLSGYVWQPPDLLEAERVASLVDGVTRVVDDLELQLNGIGNSQSAY